LVVAVGASPVVGAVVAEEAGRPEAKRGSEGTRAGENVVGAGEGSMSTDAEGQEDPTSDWQCVDRLRWA
jgi:hypothetical protein